jgi:hypothetical protein
MENILFSLFSAFLFFIISPGILLRLPKTGNKYTVGAVHAVVFAVILYLTSQLFSKVREGVDKKDEQLDVCADYYKEGTLRYDTNIKERCTGPPIDTFDQFYWSQKKAKSNCEKMGGYLRSGPNSLGMFPTQRCINSYFNVNGDNPSWAGCGYLKGRNPGEYNLFYYKDHTITDVTENKCYLSSKEKTKRNFKTIASNMQTNANNAWINAAASQ